MKNIAILYGGKSGEHEVSLLSAASILRHLDRQNYELTLIGIDLGGSWHLQSQADIERSLVDKGPLKIEEGRPVIVVPGGGREGGLRSVTDGRLHPLACDAVFPVLHGSFGEDGIIQGLLEAADLPYVGASVLGSALGMDKEKAKLLWMQAGLPVVPFIALREFQLDSPDVARTIYDRVTGRFGYPVFVKPASAGSSVGTAKVERESDLFPALREALVWDDKVLVEPFVAAREIECSVLGDGELVAFPPGEIVPSHEFYDYEAKYLDPLGARLEIPADLSAGQASRVRELAIKACASLDISGMARVDFFIDRASEEILLNEVNTIPGFTSISMYPQMCEMGGLPYPELIDRLIRSAIATHSRRARIRHAFRA